MPDITLFNGFDTYTLPLIWKLVLVSRCIQIDYATASLARSTSFYCPPFPTIQNEGIRGVLRKQLNIWCHIFSGPIATNMYVLFSKIVSPQYYRNDLLSNSSSSRATRRLEKNHRFTDSEEIPLSFTSIALIRSGCARLCQVVSGCARLCTVVPGCVRLCQLVSGCARLCQVVPSCQWDQSGRLVYITTIRFLSSF